MGFKLVNLADVVTIPVPSDLTSEEESMILAQYKSERTPERVDADYRDIEQQIAQGIPAEELFKELAKQDTSDEN